MACLAAATLLASSQAASAQQPDTAGLTSFVIEKIVVQGARHGTESIVAAETLLVAGRAYTEPQLRQALQRVERLPFVVSASLSLQRGSERGRFELVVAVVETKPIFFGGSFSTSWTTHRNTEGPTAWVGDGWGAIASPQIGARIFFGQKNELSATAGWLGFLSEGSGRTGAVDLVYRRHDLFGHRLVASLFASVSGAGTRGAGGELAVPLSSADVLTLRLSRSIRKNETSWELEPSSFWSYRATTDAADLRWQHDTTDDPFVPRRGTRFALSGSFSRGDTDIAASHDPWSSFWTSDVPPENWTGAARVRRHGASVAAGRHWPLSSRLALAAAAEAVAYRSRSEGELLRAGSLVHPTVETSEESTGNVRLQLLRLIDPKQCRTDQCWLSFETSLSTTRSDMSWDPAREGLAYPSLTPSSSEGFDLRQTDLRATLGFGARGRWGAVRFELSYVHVLRARQSQR